MLKVNRDGSLEIHRRDAFSLLCNSNEKLDTDNLYFYMFNEENEIVLEKKAIKNEENTFFVFSSDNTNLTPNLYSFVIIYNIDEQNRTVLHQNTLKVKNCI